MTYLLQHLISEDWSPPLHHYWNPIIETLKFSSLIQYLISPLAIIIGVEFITWWYSKELAVWCGGWLVALIALTAGNAISVTTNHSSYTEFPFSYRSERSWILIYTCLWVQVCNSQFEDNKCQTTSKNVTNSMQNDCGLHITAKYVMSCHVMFPSPLL